MNFDYLREKLRRRAPQSFDFEAMTEQVRMRNIGMVAEWRERFPGSTSAVLEITVSASGPTRRRLRRYREFFDARGGEPGVLIFRELTNFDDILDHRVIEISAAAARAEVADIDWRLLSVSEALNPAP